MVGDDPSPITPKRMGPRFRRERRALERVRPVLVIAFACWLASFDRLPAQSDRSKDPAIQVRYVTETSGVKFTHFKGSDGQHYYPEQFGAGAAFLDYDNDGFLDLFFVQGAALPGYKGPRPPGNVLYRNNGNGTFADVTKQARLT